MLTIAHLTFKEALRKKILVAAVLLTLLFLILYAVGLTMMARNSFQENEGMQGELIAQATKKVFLLLGIYFSSSIVSFLAIFSAVGVISSEVENGMLHAILARPIKRRDIVLGKFVGYTLMLTLYSAVLFLAILGLNRFIMGTALPSTFVPLGLFVLQPLILLSITTAGSTRLTTLANGIIVFMLYTLGVVGGMVEWIGSMLENKPLIQTGVVASLIMPADSVYRLIASSIIGQSANRMYTMFFGPFGVLSKPSSAMIIYTFVYLLTFLLIAIASFSRRDVS